METPKAGTVAAGENKSIQDTGDGRKPPPSRESPNFESNSLLAPQPPLPPTRAEEEQKVGSNARATAEEVWKISTATAAATSAAEVAAAAAAAKAAAAVAAAGAAIGRGTKSHGISPSDQPSPFSTSAHSTGSTASSSRVLWTSARQDVGPEAASGPKPSEGGAVSREEAGRWGVRGTGGGLKAFPARGAGIGKGGPRGRWGRRIEEEVGSVDRRVRHFFFTER